MNTTLYLPYINYENIQFQANNDYYTSKEEYSKTLENDYYMNKDVIYNKMNAWNSGSVDLINKSTINSQSFHNNNDDDDVKYSKCEVLLYNENYEEETIDSIINYFNENDVFILIIKFNFDTMDEEFEEDLKLWFRTHQNINNIKEADDDWKFTNQPIRNFKFNFINKFNTQTNGELLNCKLIQQMDNNTYVVLVEKINFINN